MYTSGYASGIETGAARRQPLELRGVSRRFNDGFVIDSIDLAVERGEVVGLVGPNGAGKTSLLRICEGVEPIDSGQILGSGRALDFGPGAMQTRLASVLQRPRFAGETSVAEAIGLISTLARRTLPAAPLVARLGLEPLLETRLAALSGGQRQQLAVLASLLWTSELMLLDEPSSELDHQARRTVWELLRGHAREQGTAVLISTHRMEEAEAYCDRVVIMDRGRIVVAGAPSDVIRAYGRHVALRFTTDEQAVDEIRRFIGDFATAPLGRYVKCEKRLPSLEDGQALLRTLLNTKPMVIREIALANSNLEEAYMDITGTEQRG